MKKIMTGLTVASLVAAAPLAVRAEPITYTLTGTMSGTVDGTTFTNATVDVIGVGDTTNFVKFLGTIPDVLLSSVTISITGVGTFTSSDTVYAFDNQSEDLGGFSSAVVGGNDELDFTDASALGSWDDVSALAPDPVTFGAEFGFDLSGGGAFDPASGSDMVYSASVPTPAPEPASAASLVVGLIGLFTFRSRRTAQATRR
jgi:hypothetical protein